MRLRITHNLQRQDVLDHLALSVREGEEPTSRKQALDIIRGSLRFMGYGGIDASGLLDGKGLDSPEYERAARIADRFFPTLD